MALIVCPDCRKEFSDLAQSCPSCGRPNLVVPREVGRTTAKKPPEGNVGVGFFVYLALLVIGLFLSQLVEGPGGLAVLAGLALLSGLLGLVVTACRVMFRLLQRI